MRKALWLTLVAAPLGLLAFAPVDAAGLSQDPTTSAIPHITAITDGALCFNGSCKITANVSYNTGVGISGNAVPDFAIVDLTLRTSCPVHSTRAGWQLVGGLTPRGGVSRMQASAPGAHC